MKIKYIWQLLYASSFLLCLTSIYSTETDITQPSIPSEHISQQEQELKHELPSEKIHTQTANFEETAQKISRLSSGIFISKQKALSLCQFIESDLPDYIKKGTYLLESSKSGLDFPIEYDPISKLTFILLGKNKEAFVGQGKFKIASKAILYDVKNPQIVVHCETEAPCDNEIRITKALNGLPGLMYVYAITQHETQNHTLQTSFFIKYYNLGPLSYYLKEKPNYFTFDEQLKIAHDLIEGLKNIHQHGYTHRDLSPKNLFLSADSTSNKASEILCAVIGDFGWTIKADSPDGKRPQGNIDYVAPEITDLTLLKPNDFYANDIFALGASLYRMHYNKKLPQGYKKSDFMRVKGMKSKQKAYQEKLQAIQRDFSKKLADSSNQSSCEVEFEKLIMKMIHPDPKARGAIDELYSTILAICKKEEGFSQPLTSPPNL